jgi:septal ring factor EnvC (AmiA/AmiB activator)
MANARALVLVVALAALALAHPGTAHAQSSGDAQRKLDKAQRELQSVAAERRRIEGQRGSASRELRALDEKLAGSSRALHDTEAAVAAQREALAKLQQRRIELDASLGAQKQALAALLRSAYTLGDEAPLKLLLSQDSIAEASRLLTWNSYLQRDRARRVTALTAELHELEALEQRIAERQAALDATRRREQAQLAALKGERKSHASAVAKLDARYQDKRSREKALGNDVAGLKKLLAQLRAAAARAEAARRSASARAAAARNCASSFFSPATSLPSAFSRLRLSW